MHSCYINSYIISCSYRRPPTRQLTQTRTCLAVRCGEDQGASAAAAGRSPLASLRRACNETRATNAQPCHRQSMYADTRTSAKTQMLQSPAKLTSPKVISHVPCLGVHRPRHARIALEPNNAACAGVCPSFQKRHRRHERDHLRLQVSTTLINHPCSDHTAAICCTLLPTYRYVPRGFTSTHQAIIYRIRFRRCNPGLITPGWEETSSPQSPFHLHSFALQARALWEHASINATASQIPYGACHAIPVHPVLTQCQHHVRMMPYMTHSISTCKRIQYAN